VLIQIITVDRGKRSREDLQTLAERLEARGHEVVFHRSAAARTYGGRSGDVDDTVAAIWESDRACFTHARAAGMRYTLILEEDCEIEDVAGLDVATSFLDAHLDEIDLFFLGASPNCWWRATKDPHIVKYSHVYWWHAVIVTRAFIERFDVARTWRDANDIHFSRLIAGGEVRAFGLRRQVAFQCDRRSWVGENLLYRFPWGDGRQLLATAAAGLLVWMWLRT
jgi:hypothetical protein